MEILIVLVIVLELVFIIGTKVVSLIIEDGYLYITLINDCFNQKSKKFL